ncbi:MAG: efflux RND transporter periplasmic adaptor subunit [Melioribacteraceae bacterium]|nr:efflux RND transporter periplasmic adaptor subunit [Melioribacteraceae bacterium]
MNYNKCKLVMSNKIIRNSLVAISLALIVGCSENDSREIASKIPTVRTEDVKAVEYSDRIRTTGRLAFNNEYKMSFKTSGIVKTVFVKDGQYAKKGMLLASLKLDEIESKVKQAEFSFEKAKRDFDRATALYADSVATLEQLQNAKSQLQNAEMNLQAAQFNLKHSQIVAPANGIIQKILVKENEITGAGNPIIIFGAENQGKVLVANVSDVDVVKIKIDDKTSLHFDAWRETVFNGKVLEIAGMASPSTGTYEIKIQVSDADNKLKPGFIGSATITSSKVSHQIEIPIEGLVQANNKTAVVYKVENELAIKQDVHVAKILNKKLLISSGLSENDKIIVEGLGELKGDSISVKSIH